MFKYTNLIAHIFPQNITITAPVAFTRTAVRDRSFEEHYRIS